jgi:hypothetical protein
MSSGEKPTQGFGDVRGSRAFFVIVRDVVDPCAHGVAPHCAGVIRLQQFRDGLHVGDARIVPKKFTCDPAASTR